MNKLFSIILDNANFWNFDQLGGETVNGDLLTAYNKITNILFLYVLPIIVSLGCMLCIFSIIRHGIKIGSAKTGEEKEAGKKGLGWSIGGIAIIVSAQFIIPLIVKGIFKAVSK